MKQLLSWWLRHLLQATWLCSHELFNCISSILLKETCECDYLLHECTRPPFPVGAPNCWPVCQQVELPVGTHHPRWPRLQSQRWWCRYAFLLNPNGFSEGFSGIEWSFTCHASNDRRRFDDISSLHVLCGNDPSLPVAPSDQCNVSRSEVTKWLKKDIDINPLMRRWPRSPHKDMAMEADLTCRGRIALPQPSLQRACCFFHLHSAAAESLSCDTSACGRRQFHVCESFLHWPQSNG